MTLQQFLDIQDWLQPNLMDSNQQLNNPHYMVYNYYIIDNRFIPEDVKFISQVKSSSYYTVFIVDTTRDKLIKVYPYLDGIEAKEIFDSLTKPPLEGTITGIQNQ